MLDAIWNVSMATTVHACNGRNSGFRVQGTRRWGRVPQTSVLYPVISKCKSALLASMEATPKQHRLKFFQLK